MTSQTPPKQDERLSRLDSWIVKSLFTNIASNRCRMTNRQRTNLRHPEDIGRFGGRGTESIQAAAQRVTGTLIADRSSLPTPPPPAAPRVRSAFNVANLLEARNKEREGTVCSLIDKSARDNSAARISPSKPPHILQPPGSIIRRRT